MTLQRQAKSTPTCAAASDYREALVDRWEQESQILANLTGWDIKDIRDRQTTLADLPPERPWWEQIWNK